MHGTVIEDGDEAPGFELPALVDGDHRRVALSEYVGDDVVVVAFYPGDFNPACGAESDLDELDLFTMQKDVSVLAVGPDTLYSHAAFADEYDLRLPLLADTRREVAERYGVAAEGDLGQALVDRAVFVVDPEGVVAYAWRTSDPGETPSVEEIKAAIADAGGDDTAFARYRIGHAHYTEGRRAFTSAMGSFSDSEWMLAESDFRRAREEFEEAADHFDSAVRFVDDPAHEPHYDLAERKATALWQAADWLSKSASKYGSGAGAEAQSLRQDAERPLATARDIGDPIGPDEWPPDGEPDREHESVLPDEGGDDLAADIDEAVAAAAEADDGDADGDGSEDRDGGIDDEELAAIQAELAASDDDPGELADESTSMVDAPPNGEDGDAVEADGANSAAGEGGAASDDDRNDESDDAESTGSGDIDGEVDEEELEALAEELAESQAAAEAVDWRGENGDAGDEPAGEVGDPETAGDGAAGDGAAGEDAVDDPAADRGSTGGGDGLDGGDAAASDPLAPEGDAPADPDADLSDDAGVPPAASGSLEVGPADDEPELDDEPKGASDEDLADIPTAEELDGDEGSGDQDGADTEGENDLDEPESADDDGSDGWGMPGDR
ncbi:redoxin domain-containing protein [Halomicrobium urmianum]|uniref:redoxin domain-containing protein n=1 Tax=Halomicrobium urmianum TaxID=1586233 RepID=UPI001CD9E908|nr:redoxin domain-containing protein [Halomicrobium urmianum]